ncbi:hypothetical protein SOASR029_14950 [Budvicia aquatica]|nr:hypothetical protein SOASR029_14950 [Budvicia aquatica]
MGHISIISDYRQAWKVEHKLSGILLAVQMKGSEIQVCYYISSEDLTAEKFARSIREHLGIGNRLHWCLDVPYTKMIAG